MCIGRGVHRGDVVCGMASQTLCWPREPDVSKSPVPVGKCGEHKGPSTANKKRSSFSPSCPPPTAKRIKHAQRGDHLIAGSAGEMSTVGDDTDRSCQISLWARMQASSLFGLGGITQFGSERCASSARISYGPSIQTVPDGLGLFWSRPQWVSRQLNHVKNILDAPSKSKRLSI